MVDESTILGGWFVISVAKRVTVVNRGQVYGTAVRDDLGLANLIRDYGLANLVHGDSREWALGVPPDFVRKIFKRHNGKPTWRWLELPICHCGRKHIRSKADQTLRELHHAKHNR